jgi:ribosomal protein S18 acetylase RimI-like enzyme
MYSLAIRLYPPARGKRLSAKFLEPVYKDFQKRHKNSRLWLRTSLENIRAIKLYRRFGFKKTLVDTKNHEEVMILKR